MLRVLHIFYNMGNGGIEHFVMDYYRHIDRSKMQFDFLVSVDEKGPYDEEIRALGGKIFHAYPLKKNFIKNYLDIRKIVREHNYTIVHRHTGSAFGYFELRAARSGGANHLVIHSHNNRAGNILLHYIFRILMECECERLACSQEAGRWLFGNSKEFKVLNNAIDCEKFAFEQRVRDELRDYYNLQNKFVVGHVGRFELQKNHSKLFKIFKAILQQIPESKLICVGTGSLQEECEQLAKDLGIEENIIFLGERADVNMIMQAFDVFVLPSIYEGFPISLIEAQTSGLRCVVSKCVPAECDLTGNVEFYDLEMSDYEWAKVIGENRKKIIDRSIYKEKLKQLGYDINQNAEDLCSYYFGLE